MSSSGKIRVWDLPTRLFHWLLVAAVAVAWYASRHENMLDLHVSAGIITAALVAFRVAWGIAGGPYSRFSSFVRGPARGLSYLAAMARGSHIRYMGHNPAAGLMVAALLCVIAVMAGAGLAALGGVEGQGPAAGLVGFSAGETAVAVHAILFYVVALLVVLHVAAVLVHAFVFGEDIVMGMISGLRSAGEDGGGRAVDLAVGDDPRRLTRGETALRAAAFFPWVAIPSFLIITGLVDARGVYRPAVLTGPDGARVVIVEPPLWREECAGSCHNGIHPTLLPERSWELVMERLDDHFGDDASIDAEDAAMILAYLKAASAERSTTEASRKILASIVDARAGASGEPPIQVTGTGFWKKKHSKVPKRAFEAPKVGSASNCKACHPGAEVGSFEDRDIRDVRI